MMEKQKIHTHTHTQRYIYIYIYFLKPYSLPYLDNITGGLQGEYLKTDLYA